MNYFKTPKGTELPFLNLKGKDYLQVAHRLVWFREQHPDWSIVTEVKEHDDVQSVVVAKILNAEGRVLATGHKQQSAKGFAAHLEKAESGSIGRALAFLGFGTQHAQELEEDENDPPNQWADTPQTPNKQATPPARTAPIPAQAPQGSVKKPTEAQIKRLHAIAAANNWAGNEVAKMIADVYEIKTSRDLNIEQYNELCEYLETNKPDMGELPPF